MQFKGDRFSEDPITKIRYPDLTTDALENLEKKNKTLLIGRSEDEAGSKTHAHTYSNIIIHTTPDDGGEEGESKCQLIINLKDTGPDDSEELVIRLRKMSVCDVNGKTAELYVLASQTFNEETGFIP